VPLLLLGACNDDSGGSDGGNNNAETPPGTELKLGEAATVPLDDRGVVRFTVTAIDPADPQDLAEVKEFDPATQAAFYIRYDAAVVSEAGKGLDTVELITDIAGLYGSEYARGGLVGEIEQCTYPATMPQNVEAGDEFTLCAVQTVPKGESVDAAAFYHLGDDYDRFDGEPVVWRE